MCITDCDYQLMKRQNAQRKGTRYRERFLGENMIFWGQLTRVPRKGRAFADVMNALPL